MNTLDALTLRRSIRKFRPESVSLDCLRQIVEVARLYPSGGNRQPIRFALITDKELRDAVFADLGWAMYLPDFKIEDDERPMAYIALLRDETVAKSCDYDVGAASTMVMVAAVDKGLATCALASFSKPKLSALLNLPENLHPELLIAIGYPAHESSVVSMGDTIRYTQDEKGDFLVPKWSREEVTVFEG